MLRKMTCLDFKRSKTHINPYFSQKQWLFFTRNSMKHIPVVSLAYRRRQGGRNSIHVVSWIVFVYTDVAMDFEIVSTVECTPSDLNDTSRQEMYKKLETDLVSQIKMCQANRIYFKSTGDVPSTNKFHQMEEHTKKDLDSLRFAFRRGDPVPKFHYEVRSYSKVVVCSDLTDSELEFTCVQAINLNVAKDAHTYCK